MRRITARFLAALAVVGGIGLAAPAVASARTAPASAPAAVSAPASSSHHIVSPDAGDWWW